MKMCLNTLMSLVLVSEQYNWEKYIKINVQVLHLTIYDHLKLLPVHFCEFLNVFYSLKHCNVHQG